MTRAFDVRRSKSTIPFGIRCTRRQIPGGRACNFDTIEMSLRPAKGCRVSSMGASLEWKTRTSSLLFTGLGMGDFEAKLTSADTGISPRTRRHPVSATLVSGADGKWMARLPAGSARVGQIKVGADLGTPTAYFGVGHSRALTDHADGRQISGQEPA